MALCWQVLVLGPDPAFWPGSPAGSWLAVPLSLVWVTWLLMLGDFAFKWLPDAASGPLKTTNSLLLLVTGTGMLLSTARDGQLSQGWAAGASLINLGVGVAGMLLPPLLARWIIGTAVVAEVLVVLSTWQNLGSSLRDALLYPLYATAIGAGASGARQALLRAAGRHEGALAELRGARIKSAAVARIRRGLSRQERLIHESVLNTLAAIARGGLPTGSPAIRNEAAASAEVLRAITEDPASELDPPAGDWAVDLFPVLEQLRARGVDARLEVSDGLRIDARALVGPESYGAFLVAVREALSNVERHAKAGSALVRVEEAHWRGRSRSLQVTVQDDGVGFDPAAGEPRFGVTESIARTMREVGGAGEVMSAPGQGTTVRLSAPRGGPDRQDRRPRLARGEDRRFTEVSDAIPMSNAAFARPVLAWFGAFVLASVVSTLGEESHPLLTIAALLLVIGLGAGLWILSARPSLPVWFIALAAITAPCAYRLQVLAAGGASVSHWEDWTSEALAAIWLVFTAVGPWWSVLVALGSWLLTQGDPLNELLQPGTAIILAGAVFARSVRRNNRAFAQAELQRTEELAAVIAEAQGLERMRARHELLDQSSARTLLLGVAQGRLDPGDEQVRQECGQQERFIRSVMRLDPAADLVHRHAGRAAVLAHQRGLSMDISLDDTAGWPAQSCERFFAEVRRMLQVADAATGARLTARREGDAVVMRFVARDGTEVIEVRHA